MRQCMLAVLIKPQRGDIFVATGVNPWKNNNKKFFLPTVVSFIDDTKSLIFCHANLTVQFNKKKQQFIDLHI
jgi:hypothetical protein